MYHSWVSCKRATHLPQILTKSYTLAYFVSKLVTLMIKSHEKYQSNFLDRLGHAERANGEKRSILGHNRSHWSGLRPLVTPWEFCIKEGTEPWKNQLRSLTSPVQVSNSLLSLSLSLSLSLLSSCPAMIYCSCCYLLLSLLCIFTCIGSIMTVVMNTNLVISIAKVKSSLSLFLLGDSIGLAGVAMLINITISISLSLSLCVFPPWWLSGSCKSRNAYLVHQLLSVFPPWWLSGSCRSRNAYVVHQLLSVLPPWWLSGSCRSRNAYIVHQLSLSSLLGGLVGLAGVAMPT